MKLKHCFLLAFYSILLLKQTSAQTGFSIGGSAASMLSYRTIHTDGSYTARFIKDVRDNNEFPLLGFSFAVDLMYQFKNNFVVSSALSYSTIGYQWPDAALTDINGIIEKANLRNRIFIASVPVMVGYNLYLGDSKKHALMFRLGVNNNFVVGATYIVITQRRDGSVNIIDSDSRQDQNAYYLSACANIGYYFNMGNGHHRMGINLLGDYALMPTSKRSMAVENLHYYGGLALSYLYTFH